MVASAVRICFQCFVELDWTYWLDLLLPAIQYTQSGRNLQGRNKFYFYFLKIAVKNSTLVPINSKKFQFFMSSCCIPGRFALVSSEFPLKFKPFLIQNWITRLLGLADNFEYLFTFLQIPASQAGPEFKKSAKPSNLLI